MTIDILDIYDSFLGKFQFFRNFIKVLIVMKEKIDSVEDKANKANEHFIEVASRLNEELLEVKKELNEVKDKLDILASTPQTNEPKNFTRSSPAEIMQRQYDALIKPDKED